MSFDPVAAQLSAAGARLSPDLIEPLREALGCATWGLWVTLYVDSSNAGAGAWAWGARGRATDEVADLLGAPRYLSLSGLSPEAGRGDSGIGELWGIVHAVRACLGAWPWVAGIGVRCDNAEAVAAVAGCDGRTGGRDKHHRRLGAARDALRDVVKAAGVVHLRAAHVHGHGRAEHGRQRAFNRDADIIARRAARASNRGAP